MKGRSLGIRSCDHLPDYDAGDYWKVGDGTMNYPRLESKYRRI